MQIKDYIKDVPNFPKEGIMFKDISPLMQDGKAYKFATEEILKYAKEVGATVIVGPEARGFIIGCPVAVSLEMGFVPVRKPGKLPRETIEVEYDLEYGTDTLCMHADALKKGDKVLIVDDILATGGTMEATIKLVEQLGAEVVGLAFILELADLNGQERIKQVGDYDIKILESM